jgi:glycosyltransferase involved in cell wall biosynthesis
MESEKVSVIIPTYNRFKYLLNCIDSIKSQTHKNIEIIIVNDCSTQPEYYTYDWNGINIIHMPTNSKDILGYACTAIVRNQGIHVASGDYIAFCDDDDIWFPNKLELQLIAMKQTGCRMSCTEGLYGEGPYVSSNNYLKYNSECAFEPIKQIFMDASSNAMDAGFPDIWDLNFLKVHNCVITSSVVMKRDLIHQIGYMKCLTNAKEDYDYWLSALEFTNCVYVKDVCFYYDGGHGYGKNY